MVIIPRWINIFSLSAFYQWGFFLGLKTTQMLLFLFGNTSWDLNLLYGLHQHVLKLLPTGITISGYNSSNHNRYQFVAAWNQCKRVLEQSKLLFADRMRYRIVTNNFGSCDCWRLGNSVVYNSIHPLHLSSLHSVWEVNIFCR